MVKRLMADLAATRLKELGGIRDNLKAIEREKAARAFKNAKEAIKGDDNPEIKPNGRRKTRFEKLKKGADRACHN